MFNMEFTTKKSLKNGIHPKEKQIITKNNYEYFNYCFPEAKTVDLAFQRKLALSLIGNHEVERTNKTIKRPVEVRQEEVMAIRSRFPNKIPVIVSRLPKEKNLPKLEKNKYLVPKEITLGQFVSVLRNRMHLNRNKTIYMIIEEKSIMCPTLTMAEIYKHYCNEDGYLYVTYGSQEVFG